MRGRATDLRVKKIEMQEWTRVEVKKLENNNPGKQHASCRQQTNGTEKN